MNIIDNYESRIWLGLREGYTENTFDIREVRAIVSSWCNLKKQCVSITPTEFVYVGGAEPGAIIGFINYPRFPLSKAEIKNRSIELGTLLMETFKQYRVSITFYPTVPGGTMMLENGELKQE